MPVVTKIVSELYTFQIWISNGNHKLCNWLLHVFQYNCIHYYYSKTLINNNTFIYYLIFPHSPIWILSLCLIVKHRKWFEQRKSSVSEARLNVASPGNDGSSQLRTLLELITFSKLDITSVWIYLKPDWIHVDPKFISSSNGCRVHFNLILATIM